MEEKNLEIQSQEIPEETEEKQFEAAGQEREEARRRREEEKQEKKDRRAQARRERHKEVRFLWRTVEFVMLVTFIVLAIDQAGLYGFLFVWLLIGIAAASVVLLLSGVIRALAGKRTGLILLTGLIGMIGSVAWFLFLAKGIGTF